MIKRKFQSLRFLDIKDYIEMGYQIFMSKTITDEIIDYISILTKLELSDKERVQAKTDMKKMLDYIDKLNELDTTDIEPSTHIFNTQNVFREDIITNSDERENILKNAPNTKNNMFVVPRII